VQKCSFKGVDLAPSGKDTVPGPVGNLKETLSAQSREEGN